MYKKISYTEAIEALYPRLGETPQDGSSANTVSHVGLSFYLSDPYDYDTLEWRYAGTTKPTKQQLDTMIDTLQAEYQQRQYQRDRVLLYPAITDQLDMLWHAMDQDIISGKDSEWYTTLKNIKDKYPKA